jgi:hypothetical protein
MKKILIALALVLSVQVAGAQVKSAADSKKAVEAAEAAAQNPKKALKPATWLKLGDAYVNAYNSPYGNAWVGAGKQELMLIMGSEKPSSTEMVELMGEPYTKEVYAEKNFYFNGAGVLAMIEVTKPVYGNALAKALDAYKKAYEVDVKHSKDKDVAAGIHSVAAKYLDEGMTQYMLGDIKAANACFCAASEASETAPLNVVDTTATYNAGFTMRQQLHISRSALMQSIMKTERFSQNFQTATQSSETRKMRRMFLRTVSRHSLRARAS